MENDKYVVFKNEGLEYRPAENKYVIQNGSEVQVHDAVVIRLQDVFAGPGLYGYSSAIQTAIDFIEHRWDDEDISQEQADQRARLEELRDFFADQAEIATQHPNKKVPD